MTAEELKARTKRVALDVIRLTTELRPSVTTEPLVRQLLKSGTGAGAAYRAACRAKSRADFAATLAILEEEADDSAYWLELLAEAGLVRRELVSLLAEANELIAITVASIRTVTSHTVISCLNAPPTKTMAVSAQWVENLQAPHPPPDDVSIPQGIRPPQSALVNKPAIPQSPIAVMRPWSLPVCCRLRTGRWPRRARQ
jgi:four helix bundle protein